MNRSADTHTRGEARFIWDGDIIAGILRSRNWSARLTATRAELVLAGPMNMHYVLSRNEVREVRSAVGKFLFWSWKMRRAITFIHESRNAPSTLVFHTRQASTREVLDCMKTLGYAVS